MKKGFLSICFLIFVALCGNTAVVHAEQKADMDGAKAAVTRAYQNYQTQVDVSAYHIDNLRDSKALENMLTKVVHQTAGIFYAGTEYSKYVDTESNRVVKLQLGYLKNFKTKSGAVDTAKIREVKAQINQKINQAYQEVKPGMTQVEKALVLHDYLVRNTQYLEKQGKGYRLSEWGALVKGKANCQGYTLAYGLLLQRAGIPFRYVRSTQMKHIWNMIQIDGKWYHVDVTWDDPVDTIKGKDQLGLVMHDRFLCSTAKMKASGYYGFSGKAAKSKKYDNSFWRNVHSGIVYRKGWWLYQTGYQISQRKHLISGKEKALYAAGGGYFIPLNRNKYYFINYNSIYLYDRKKNKVSRVLSGDDYHEGSYQMSQLKYKAGKLSYRIIRGSQVTTVTRRVKKSGFLVDAR